MAGNRVVPAEDKRGAKWISKKDRALITSHIESFNAQVSQYRRDHAPNRRHLQRDLSIKFMFDDFKRQNVDFKCCYQTNRTVFSASNISLAKPDNDICDDCAYYTNQEQTEENRFALGQS